MTLSRATYRGRSIVIGHFEKFGDGERCGSTHRPLYPHTRTIAGVLENIGRGLAYVICGGFPISGARSGVRESQGLGFATEHPVHAAPSFSFGRALQSHKQSRNGFMQWFQFCLSAGSGAGLVACGYGQTIGERKQPCPNQDGANPHRNGV